MNTSGTCVEALSLEGVSQMDSILPERLLALVRPAFDLVLRRIRSLKRCVQACGQNSGPKICAAIWLQVAFQAMSSFAKGNPFSLFFGDPFFWDPLFSFFLFFLSPAKVGSLEMQPGAKLRRISWGHYFAATRLHAAF